MLLFVSAQSPQVHRGRSSCRSLCALQLLRPGSGAGSRTARVKRTEGRLSHVRVLQQAHKECTGTRSIPFFHSRSILQTCCMPWDNSAQPRSLAHENSSQTISAHSGPVSQLLVINTVVLVMLLMSALCLETGSSNQELILKWLLREMEVSVSYLLQLFPGC